MIVKYKNFVIEITNESNLDSAEFGQIFKKQYPADLGNKLEFEPSSKHGIRITQNGIEKCSALLLESGGATGISDNSFLIKNDRIYICCSDHIYCLNLADLSANWRNQYDITTCFGIYEFNEDFIVHGEIQVSRINENGETKWNFSARDIFVNPDGKKEFKIIKNRIELIDWDGYKYELNAEGKILNEEKTA
jgi:outer membrane protein assembly factor BamB